MVKDKLVLASDSPRRVELLKECRIDFETTKHTFDESSLFLKNPRKLAEALAFKKAESVAITELYKNRFVLGSDTIVAVKNKILGKPDNEKEALFFMKLLSGRVHKVITGVSLINSEKSVKCTKSEVTYVKFDKISDKFIKYYLDNNLWRGYAGGYAIQESIFNLIVKKIKGSYSNIVGLPVNLLYEMLQEVDFKMLW